MIDRTFGSDSIAFELKRLGLYGTHLGVLIACYETGNQGGPRRYALFSHRSPWKSRLMPAHEMVGILAQIEPGTKAREVIRLVDEGFSPLY